MCMERSLPVGPPLGGSPSPWASAPPLRFTGPPLLWGSSLPQSLPGQGPDQGLSGNQHHLPQWHIVTRGAEGGSPSTTCYLVGVCGRLGDNKQTGRGREPPGTVPTHRFCCAPRPALAQTCQSPQVTPHWLPDLSQPPVGTASFPIPLPGREANILPEGEVSGQQVPLPPCPPSSRPHSTEASHFLFYSWKQRAAVLTGPASSCP